MLYYSLLLYYMFLYIFSGPVVAQGHKRMILSAVGCGFDSDSTK